jgi:hypothetical protein
VGNALSDILRRHRVDALADEAIIVRDWPQSPERRHEAEMLIREAMYRCAIGRITHEEESRIFSILAFAMPDDAW